MGGGIELAQIFQRSTSSVEWKIGELALLMYRFHHFSEKTVHPTNAYLDACK